MNATNIVSASLLAACLGMPELAAQTAVLTDDVHMDPAAATQKIFADKGTVKEVLNFEGFLKPSLLRFDGIFMWAITTCQQGQDPSIYRCLVKF